MSSSSDGHEAHAGTPIRVLIVDDSALIRRVLSEIVARQPDMKVVGAAPDALVARGMIRAENPDVLTLDVEMPKMSGLDFLEKLMRLRPMPVLMVSSLTRAGTETTLRALELGAVDFVAKPTLEIEGGMAACADEIVAKIRMAARLPRRRVSREPHPLPLPALGSSGAALRKVVCIGASTGGTEAIRALLQRLPSDAPPVLVTQHMPPGFTATFAARLDKLCAVRVVEAADGMHVERGTAYVAPGGMHLAVARDHRGYVARVQDGEPVNRHKPSVAVLFDSAAGTAGPDAIAVILTGMGKDGAAGLLAVRHAGGHTIAQDEASCVVFGMPREAIALGAAMDVLPLSAIAGRVMAIAAGTGVETMDEALDA